MKKFFSILIALTFLSAPITPCAEVIGHIYKTDINAYENYMQIPSYNCGGTTVVFARDLENYGYDVLWDEESMTVEISKNSEKAFTPMLPTIEGDEPVGTILFDIYRTDIKTFFEGKLIPAYNIGGKIAIEFRSLGNGTNVKFDEKSRRAHIFTREISLSDEDIKHIDYIYELIRALEIMEDDINDTLKSVKNGKYTSVSSLKKSHSSLEEIIETLKEYTEPGIFTQSTMEIWWALVNINLATDMIVSSGKALSGENKEKFDRYMADSRAQKENALKIMAREF